MQFILNVLLYCAQKIVMRIGGEVRYTRDRIELHAPDGKHWNIPKRYTLNEFRGTEANRQLMGVIGN